MATSVLRGLASRCALAGVGVTLTYFLAAASLDPRAELENRSPRPPRAAVEARLRTLGMDDHVSLPRRYATWAWGVVRGDFGETLDGVPVRGELRRRAGVSLRLVLAGALLGTAGGVAMGAYAATRQYGRPDRLLTAGALVTLSVPAFALAVLLQTAAQWVNIRTGVRAFEWTGEFTPGGPAGLAGETVDRLRHLVLPTMTIAFGQAAIYARYQRGTMIDALNTDYVRAALARGLRRRQVLIGHALRVAIVPTTTLAAYGFVALLTGAAIAEKIYAWHGLGEWLIDSIRGNDVNSVAACGCTAALAIAAATLLCDLTRAAVDPRTRT